MKKNARGYVERLADLYPLGVHCEARFLKGVGVESTEPNDMVDNQILFSVSTTHWDDELPSRLVTCENDHIKIAAESHEGSVVHLDDYFREVGVAPVVVDRSIPRPDN